MALVLSVTLPAWHKQGRPISRVERVKGNGRALSHLSLPSVPLFYLQHIAKASQRERKVRLPRRNPRNVDAFLCKWLGFSFGAPLKSTKQGVPTPKQGTSHLSRTNWGRRVPIGGKRFSTIRCLPLSCPLVKTGPRLTFFKHHDPVQS